MTLKNAPFYFPLLLCSILLSSCEKNKGILSFDEDAPSIYAEKMQLNSTDFKPLSKEYLEEKRKEVSCFFNKNWNSKNNTISFLVAKDGQIIYENYIGFANFRDKIPINSETPLHIASVTKVITATAILKLINSDQLQLNQKVTSLLDGFPYPDVTVETLLNHRSGMRNYAYFTDKKEIWDRNKTLTNQELLKVMIDKKIDLEYKTDTRFAYCNTNYAMLALIIEKITGMSYSAAIKSMIFDPLEMNNSFVFDDSKDKERVTTSYRGVNREIGFDFLDAIYGDKNIYSTPRDLMKFDLARNSPHFLDPKLKSLIFKGYSNEHKGKKNYGLGIRMIEWETGQQFFFHNGWWHGNRSSYVSLIKENVVIIALTNTSSKQVYKIRELAPVFGDYPFQISNDEE